jgi:hypothetical protein
LKPGRTGRFFNEGIRPERLHEFGLGERPAAVLHKQEEQIECLLSEGHGLAVAAQLALGDVQDAAAELV